MKIRESLLVHKTPDLVLSLIYALILDNLTRTILEEVKLPTVLLPGEAS